MDLNEAIANALDQIVAHPAPAGEVSFCLCGSRTGRVEASEVLPRDIGTTPVDVLISYAGDSYDLCFRGEQVSGAIHTLRSVLRRRLLSEAARNPANRAA